MCPMKLVNFLSQCHRILLKCIFKQGGGKRNTQANHNTRGRALYHTEKLKFQGQHKKDQIIILKVVFRLARGCNAI